MSTLSIRLPESLHEKAKEIAKKEGISVNQFMASALAEKLAALLTEEYLNERSARGDRTAFAKVMAKVHDRQPDRGDELPIVNPSSHRFAYGRVAEPVAGISDNKHLLRRLAGIIDRLTDREKQICLLLLQSPEASTAHLGQLLGVEASTVHSHMNRIRRKLGLARKQSLRQFLETI